MAATQLLRLRRPPPTPSQTRARARRARELESGQVASRTQSATTRSWQNCLRLAMLSPGRTGSPSRRRKARRRPGPAWGSLRRRPSGTDGSTGGDTGRVPVPRLQGSSFRLCRNLNPGDPSHEGTCPRTRNEVRASACQAARPGARVAGSSSPPPEVDGDGGGEGADVVPVAGRDVHGVAWAHDGLAAPGGRGVGGWVSSHTER